VSDWKTRITAVQTALNSNDATGTEAANNNTAKTNVNSTLTDINSWQSFSVSGQTRFGTGLSTLQTRITTRTGQLSTRSTQITTALGTVTQSSADGSYTGSGAYYNFFDNINQRLNLMTGTLRNYYQQDLAIQAAYQTLNMAKAQASRDSETFSIRLFSSDATGSNKVELKDRSGLNVGDSVKVMSNTQPVITTTITGINDLEIQLAASIPTTYTVSDKARIVK
jgi:hypothetical protein